MANKIYYGSPYSLEKSIGKAYNDYMKMLPDDTDWMCFVDGDVMFLTRDYGHQLQAYIYKYPNTGMFTCYTNRVGNMRQCYKGEFSENPDILHHTKIAMHLQENHRMDVKPMRKVISGHLMMIQKKVWKRIPFVDNGKILAVDNNISRRLLQAKYKILLMQGVYVFHYYRMLEGGRKYKAHLK